MKLATDKTNRFGCLVSATHAMFVQTLDAIDDDSEVHVTYQGSYFGARPNDPWRTNVYENQRLRSCCTWSCRSVDTVFRCVLSEEGQVNIFGSGGAPDMNLQIPDAGVWREGAAGYGYVGRIRAIGDSLYVCGTNRQVYRFVVPTHTKDAADLLKRGHFQHMDEGLLMPLAAPYPGDEDEEILDQWLDDNDLCLCTDITGSSEADIYVTGDETWHFDGQTWRQLTLPNDDETMHVIKVIDADTVVIGGANGYLLLGNARTGFKNISSVDDNQTITGLEVFNSTLYIASDSGLFTYNRQSKRIEPYRTDLKVDLVDAHLLEAKDGILWSFGYKDLAYFDGKTWVRLHNPENTPVDAPQPKKARPAPDDSDDPSEADLAAIAAAQRQALSWLPAAPRRGAAAGSPSLDIGGLFARVGHIGVGQFVLDQLQACGLKPAQILQTKKGERYTVNIPQQGVSLVLQYAPELAADTADDALDKRSPANWALAEVLTQTQYAHSSNHWQGAWLGKLDPNGRNVLAQARALWDEEQASTATQASFFVDAPHGAAWVINLEWTSAQGQLKALKVLNLGGYLPWDEAAAG